MKGEWSDMGILKHFLPRAHRYVCRHCGEPVHPWEDSCSSCGAGLIWPEEEKMEEPDWFSRMFERTTSYKRWVEGGRNE